MDVVKHTIGIMDPFGLSFRFAFEQLLADYDPEIRYGSRIHTVRTVRETNHAYDSCAARADYDALINRGDQWHPHHTSHSMITARRVYLVNDMASFQAVNKNTAYAQMHELGLHIPKTWALPSFRAEPGNDFPAWVAPHFQDLEAPDLRRIGEAVGYPAFLKPQSGGGWRGVTRVRGLRELEAAYKDSGGVPVNLQRAVDYREFVRTIGIGPQMQCLHYNASAEHSHDRYLRSASKAIDFDFITNAERIELSRIAKLINAFYGWDHNSCEALIGRTDHVIYPIDFANVSPDSKVISLHFFFPEILKSMMRWLLFVVVTGRRKPMSYSYLWDQFYAERDRAREQHWSYAETLRRYEEIADRHFQTAEFNDFVAKHLPDFEERAYRWFAGPAFDRILETEVNWVFKIPHERPRKLAHYRGLHQFWLHCERDRLGLRA